MNESAPLRIGLPKFDPRDDPQIDAQIDDELTFHIEQVMREFVEAGQSDADAKVNALAQFGNVQQIKAQCKRIALEEQIMLQRINLVLMLVVLLVVAFIGVQMYVTQKHNTLALQTIVDDLANMKNPPTGKSPGFVYIEGDVSRPGIYAVRADGRLMLSQLMLWSGLDALPVDVSVIRKIDGIEKVVWSGSFATIADLGRGVSLAPEDHVTITKSDEL